MTDWLGFGAQVIAGLSGVGGGLLVYSRSQSDQRRQERDARSVEAAGSLLVALHTYREDRDAPGGRRVLGEDSEQSAWRVFRLSLALYLPNLQDAVARAALLALRDFLQAWGRRRPPEEQAAYNEKTQEEARAAYSDRLTQREVLEGAAESAVVAYLERAAATGSPARRRRWPRRT